MSRPSHRSAAAEASAADRASAESAEGQEPDSEFDPVFGPGFPDPFEAVATLTVPPPSAVDIERAMTDGRRARRKRAVGVTSTVAAGLAACCVAVLVTTGNGGAARPETTDSALSVTGTNPFVVGARFGWLPEGVAQDSWSLLHGALWISADNNYSTSSGGQQIGIELSLFPAGSGEQSALATINADAGTVRGVKVQPVTALAQPSINGRPAYTLTNPIPIAPDVRQVTLLWQLANGRWAELSDDVQNTTGSGADTDAAELLAQARHAAETVTPDASGTPLPFSISGLPSGAQVTSYSLVRQSASPTDWVTAIGVEVAGVSLVYDEGPVGEVLPMTLGPTKCTTHNGLEACVTLASGSLSSGFPAGGLQALADDVSLRSPSQTTWTMDAFSDY